MMPVSNIQSDKPDRQALKRQLILRFGLYIAPLMEFQSFDVTGELPSLTQLRLGIKRFKTSKTDWEKARDTFLKEGKFELVPPDFGDFYYYTSKVYNLEHDLYSTGATEKIAEICHEFRVLGKTLEIVFFEQLDALPIEWDAETFGGNAPLSVAMRVQDGLASARKRVHYFDRYLLDDIFPLYLRHLDRSLEVRLITTAGNAKGNFGVGHVKQLSKLAQQEFLNYQLIQVAPSEMHGRVLRVDDAVFYLGTGITTGGKPQKYPTEFAPGDSSPKGHKLLDDIIRSGTVIS